jgi:N-acetylmuramoyl-L-alanine amidase
MVRDNFKILFIGYLLSFAICGLLSGCATIPKGPGLSGLPIYNIGGINYVPLIPICEQRGIKWEYDTFTRTVNLSKDLHKIDLKVGDTLVLVDGRQQYLSQPVDIYQGAVVVPLRFKEKLLDNLFREIKPHAKYLPLSLRIKKVIVDAGHGGNDPGAIGRTGLREKDINLDIAKRLAKLLSSQGIGVTMTRSTDKFVSLASRVDIANSSEADLFISIHSNANRVKGLNGFEVYYVSPYINDFRRALAAAQNAKPNLDKSCFASDSLNLKATLWDMIYNSSRAESITLAHSICHSIGHDLDTKVLGVKGANFYVLKGARTPAVLIEIGFVSNPAEERLLRNGYYRQQIAEAVAAGINNYAQDYTIMEASN